MPQQREGNPIDLSKVVKDDGSINLKEFAKLGPDGEIDFFGFRATFEKALNIDGKGKCPFGAMVSSAFAKEGLTGVRDLLRQNGLGEKVPISDEQIAMVDTRRQEALRRAGEKKRFHFR